jgi:site-specific recombinase XerD
MSARLEALQRSFARHLRAEGRSDRTVFISRQAMSFFSSRPKAQGRAAAVDELTRAAIREWLAHLSDINEASTVKTGYRGLFRFCGLLVDENQIPKNPLRTLRLPQPKIKPFRSFPTKTSYLCSRGARARSSVTEATRP